MNYITPEMVLQIEKILARGGTVEIKKSNGKVQLVQIERQLKIMTPITG